MEWGALIFVHFTNTRRMGLEQPVQHIQVRAARSQAHQMQGRAAVRVAHGAALRIVAQCHLDHSRGERRVFAEVVDA
eukprot:COSAG06_NODE_36678_length_444_cov_0.782609_1_plen_76_part_01